MLLCKKVTVMVNPPRFLPGSVFGSSRIILSGWILAPHKPNPAFRFLDRDLREVQGAPGGLSLDIFVVVVN